MPRKTKIPKEEWNFIKWLWNNKCAYCKSGKFLTKEHIIPISKGGARTYLQNIIPACNNCNSQRSSDPIEKFLRKHHRKKSTDRIIQKIYNYQLLMSKKYRNTKRVMVEFYLQELEKKL